MKSHNILKAVSFILIFFLLLTGVSYIVRTNGDVKDRFAGFYAEEKDSIDVLLCGSSTVGTSFSPGYMWGSYGFTSYPISSNTQRPKAIRYLLEEAYKYQDPEVVVIELRMFTYEDEEMKTDEPHIREVTDNMKYSLQRIKTVHALTDGVDGFDNKISYYFDIMKYHSNWGMFFLPEELQKVTYEKADLHKGFEHPTAIMYHDASIDAYIPIEDRMSIPQEQEETLRELIRYLKEKEQRALFVVSPIKYDHAFFAKANYMKDIVESEGFQYVNMMEEADPAFATDFFDGAHTNILGARKCSEALGEILSREYGLLDKRGQNGYDSWDESYDAFWEIYDEVNNNKEKYTL